MSLPLQPGDRVIREAPPSGKPLADAAKKLQGRPKPKPTPPPTAEGGRPS